METINPIHTAFQITKKIIFFVDYNVREDKTHYFSTSCCVFNQPKTDYKRCGQCQEDILPDYLIAYNFFEKWNKYHLKSLTTEQYNKLLNNIKELEQTYNYIIQNKNDHIPFDKIKTLSKLDIKNHKGFNVY